MVSLTLFSFRPGIQRMVRGKRDRTVTLFVHYLMKATSATEYGAFVEFLSAVLPHTEDVMTPSVSDLTATLRIFGNVRKGSNDCLVSFFKKLGAGLPSIQSDPRFSLKLFEVIGGLWNFITVDDRAWNLCPSLVAQLPVILSLDQPFWKNLYTLLSTLAHQYQDISSEDSFSRASNDVGIYNMIRRCHKPLTTALQKGRDRDASVLVVAFIQAGVFSFLDSVVSCLSFEAGHGMYLFKLHPRVIFCIGLFADNRTATGEGSHFFFVGVFLNDILTVCETYPDAISTLRPYLPLPRLLRTSLDAVYAHNAHPPPTEITDVTKLDLRALAWYSLARLQQMCTVRGECQARGCKRSGKLYRCKGCLTMLYCGSECQTRCVFLLGLLYIGVGHHMCSLIILSCLFFKEIGRNINSYADSSCTRRLPPKRHIPSECLFDFVSTVLPFNDYFVSGLYLWTFYPRPVDVIIHGMEYPQTSPTKT